VKISELTPEELLGPLNEVEMKNAPARLFVAGDLTILEHGARVSIVGTRKPSSEGASQAVQLAAMLASKGVVVVSGLAEGIDTSAHKGSLGAGGRTVAIIGTPLDVSYPKQNAPLQERLTSEQLVISQFPQGRPTRPSDFPMRNRTMALLSDATVIIEAGDGSGTLHQGWEALRLGRPLFILDSAAQNDDLEWPKQFLRYGAIPLSVDQPDLILEFVPESRGAAASAPSF